MAEEKTQVPTPTPSSEALPVERGAGEGAAGGPAAGGAPKEFAEFEKYPTLKRIEKIDEVTILVERIDGMVMLVRRGYPCPHRTRGGDYAEHLHFHIAKKDEIDTPYKLERRLSWLEAGFWSDSGIWDCEEGLRNLITRFLKYRCAGALTWGG